MLTTSIPLDKKCYREIKATTETPTGFKDASLFRNSKQEGYIITRMWTKDWELVKSWKHTLSRQSMLMMAEWLND